MDEQQKRHYTDLAEMREAVPVTWAILVGKRTITKIAEHLIMAPSRVQKEVDALIENDIVKWGAYMGRPILQVIDPSHKALADFAWKFRQKVLGKEVKVKK